MHQQRIEKLQAMLRKDRVDGALYADSGNMQYFLDDRTYFWQRASGTGYGRTPAERALGSHFYQNPDCMLLIPAYDEPVLIVTHNRAGRMGGASVRTVAAHYPTFAYALAAEIKGWQRIAVGECCADTLRALIGRVDGTIVTPDGETYGERLRLIKDAQEIERMRAVAAFTDRAMARITKALVPGATPLSIKALIGQIALEGACTDLSFDPGVICVREGAPASDVLFSYPDDMPITEGTAISFDFGFIRDGYCSDYGRSFYCGTSPKVRAAYAALQEAQLELFRQIKPGVSMAVTYDILYHYLEPLGWARYLRRDRAFLMGHQIGTEVHERPWLRADEDEAVFEPGMVMCIEPKIWWPGHCYLRCEDMVLITETGCEPLTTYDRTHFEL